MTLTEKGNRVAISPVCMRHDPRNVPAMRLIESIEGSERKPARLMFECRACHQKVAVQIRYLPKGDWK